MIKYKGKAYVIPMFQMNVIGLVSGKQNLFSRSFQCEWKKFKTLDFFVDSIQFHRHIYSMLCCC